MTELREECIQVRESVKIAVKIKGEGEPIVFLHGAGGLNWDSFLEELSQHYKVYAPHLPGTANSSGIESIRDLWDLILCYYDLFEKLGLESVDVIGHSLGGMIACELAATDQSRINRLITICPAGLWRQDMPIPDLFAMLPEEMQKLVWADPNSELAKQMRQLPDDLDERLEAKIHQIENMQAAAKFLWPIPDKGLKYRIHRIKAPTLIIWGNDDKLIPPVYGEDFKEKIKGSELIKMNNASHMILLEQTERVISAIHNFLQSKVQTESL